LVAPNRYGRRARQVWMCRSGYYSE
jgi:hypothetical protein